jgi:hypothetical protein
MMLSLPLSQSWIKSLTSPEASMEKRRGAQAILEPPLGPLSEGRYEEHSVPARQGPWVRLEKEQEEDEQR